MKFQITFLGANTLFGRVASALLSRTPSVNKLKLYDEVENPLLGSNIEETCVVQWHRGKDQLSTALEGSDIVVIGDDRKVIFDNEKDAVISTASKVVDFVYAVAQTAPKAMVVVAASPLNLMVPLAGYVLKEYGCYDGRKLLGVTSVDTLRANAIYSEYISQPNSILPVVGGASPQTRVPIFSHARPCLDLPEEDLHNLIDKIKSFDLVMEGTELKVSTLEHAYATVRLVNSLLSGLQEEPSTKEMALAKTALIPEVNYFSLPVDLGKCGIERTFGLPQLSPLETEMIDYAIINLNNDLIKAQDLYASFKPCFEMLKSIVGGSSRYDVMKEDGTVLWDSKSDTRKKKDHKMKSNRRRRELHSRNRKRKRANKYPILHCPAPEVVTDKPIEERFGKIERVHKKLQVNQILHGRNANELPMLKSKEVSDAGQARSPLKDSDIPLNKVPVIKNRVEQKLDRTNKITDLVPVLLNSPTNVQLPFSNREIPKIIDLWDIQNNSIAIFKAAAPKFVCKKNIVDMGTLEDETEISKNVKVTIDLKCKIKNKNLYEHLQPKSSQSQSSRIETIKSVILQKQKQYQNIKALNRNNSSTSKNKIEHLKKKAMELNTCNIRSSNTPTFANLQSPEKHKGVKDEINSDSILRKQTNKNSNMEELPELEKIEKNSITMPENDSVLAKLYSLLKENIKGQKGTGISEQEVKTEIETKGGREMGIQNSVLEEQYSLLKENIEEQNGTGISKQEVITEIETKGGQEMGIQNSVLEEQCSLLKENIEGQNGTGISKQEVKTEIETKGGQEMGIQNEEVFTTKENQKDNNRNPVGDKVDALKVNDKINETHYEHEQTMAALPENNLLGEKSGKIHESCSLKKETNEKALKDVEKHIFVTLTCEEDERKTQLASLDNNVSTADNKGRELNENEIIPEEKIAVSNYIASDISSEKSNEMETDEKNENNFRIKTGTETMTEAEKQFTKARVHDVNKEENETIDEEMSKQIPQTGDYNKIDKRQKFSFTSDVMLDDGKAVIEIDAQEKLEELECLFKREKRDKLKENNQKITDANTSKVSFEPLVRINKIREITMQKLKAPLKYLNPSKQDKTSKTERVEGTKKTMEIEETKKIKEIKEVPESIEVFNYEPKGMRDTRNITNINEMIQCLVKSNKPEENSELSSVVEKSFHDIKDHARFDSNKMKVMNLKKKAEQLIMEHNQQPKDEKLKKNDRVHASIKKPAKETPFPFLKKMTEMPKHETFDKSNWLKQRMSDEKRISNPKPNLKTIDESNALTIYSRNINESFTKRIQKGHCSNKTADDTKSISYTIDTKSKKDELSKRYTILKKGQICNMVKNDINADELKAKLYQNSLMRATIKPSVKRNDKKMTNIKDLSFTELLKSPPTNKEISSSEPSSNVLEATRKASYNITKDQKNLKNNNNNVVTLKNKSFLNLDINRMSKRSPTLNETTETIGIRGSHYGSGTYSKKPTITNEEKIQQFTQKAKDQIKISKFKNNKRISPGLSGGLPVVSNEFGEQRQPVIDKQAEKTKSTKDLTDNMLRSRNKIQQMKEKYQRLKNANLPTKIVYPMSSPSGTNFIKAKGKKKNQGIKNPVTESVKNSSKSNPEPKCEKTVIKKDEIVLKEGELLSSIEKCGKEITMNGSEKPKSEPQDLVLDKKDDTSTDINTDKNHGINSTQVYDIKLPSEGDEKCSDLSQIIPNPTPSVVDNNITVVTHKNSSQDNQQDSQDKNKSIKECNKELGLPKTIQEKSNIMSNTKAMKDETNSNVEKRNKSPSMSMKILSPKKKVYHDRAQKIDNYKTKESIKDISYSKDSPTSALKEKKSQEAKVNLSYQNALMKIKNTKKKQKKLDEDVERATLKGIFSTRPTAADLIKLKQEQKSPETDTTNSRTYKDPPFNFGDRGVVENNLIPRHSTASSLLIDPDIEKRPSTSRKEIHPSLMHAVKPFPNQNTDYSKLKTNFYSRWTPQTLKLKENIEGDNHISKNERIKKNPFVSGKINLTSDLFKAYMKKNRNYELTNSNGDVQFFHQSGQLASIPQQGVSANTRKLNDQRVAFSTLEANSEKKKNPKKDTPKNLTVATSFRFQSKPKPSISEKPPKSPSSLFNKPMRINKISKETPSREFPVKGKNILHSSYKSQPQTMPKNKPVLNKSNEKLNHPFNPFRCREKEVDLKRMHLLKAFQNEDNGQKLEELQRNYKQQLCRTSANAFKTQHKEVSKETSNRLQMLKRRSLESIKNVSSEDSRRNKKPFSAPADYHPSFPLSKPKRYEKNNKKEESGNTLKKRWTQLLDIFQSVITTEKKNWENDSPGRNLLVGSQLTKNVAVPKAKIILRETLHNSDSTAKRIQSYYRRHSVSGPQFLSSYSLSNRTNKM